MSIHKKVETSKAPLPLGPYSQGVRAGDLLFISGQLGLLSDGKLASTIEEQTTLVLTHIESLLQEEGLSFTSVVKVEVYLKDLKDFQKMNQIYAEKFLGPIYPARVTVEVSKLPLDALIEISCIAYYS